MKTRVETFQNKAFHNLQNVINVWFENNSGAEYVDVKVTSTVSNGEWQHSALLVYRLPE